MTDDVILRQHALRPCGLRRILKLASGPAFQSLSRPRGRMLRSVLKQNAAHIAPAPVPVAQQVHLPSQYSPRSWTGYFDRLLEVKPHEGSSDTFGVYSACDPTYVAHGSRSALRASSAPIPARSSSSCTVLDSLLSHGHSLRYSRALVSTLTSVLVNTEAARHVLRHRLSRSWYGLCSACLQTDSPLRAGSTKTADDDDLSAERLCNDVVSIGKQLFVPLQETNKPPRVIIVGHRCATPSRVGSSALVWAEQSRRASVTGSERLVSYWSTSWRVQHALPTRTSAQSSRIGPPHL